MARRTTHVTHGTSGTPEPDPHRSTPPQQTDPGYEDPHLRTGGAHTLDPDDDHFIPDRTIPQGTQWYAVDGAHEERDVNVPTLIRWGIGLIVLTAGTCLLIFGAFSVALNQEKAAPKPTSVMMQPTIPPLPRLIPNRIDEEERTKLAGLPAGKSLPLQDPIAYHQEQKALEAPEAASLGLLDLQTKLPVLPEGAVEAVNTLNGKGGASAHAADENARIEWIAPSDMSGGINNEDRLR